MPDMHKGFQDTGQTSDAQTFFDFLDAADSVESVQAYRRLMLDLRPIAAGDRVLDVGCGIGHSALRMATMVGRDGNVVGVDKSATLIAEARRRAGGRPLPAQFRVGDARNLEFPPHSFDLCRAERMLMYLDDAGLAVNEMLRVTRPGGELALFEFDYDGIVVDATD